MMIGKSLEGDSTQLAEAEEVPGLRIDLKAELAKHWVPAEKRHQPRKSPQYHPVILKLELLSQGLRVSPAASEEIGKTLKVDHAVGAVGKHALDIILDPG